MSDLKYTQTPSSAAAALHRAKLARFIAAVFGEPDPTFRAQFVEPEVANELRAAAGELGIDMQFIDSILASLANSGVNGESYSRLLGHTVRSECPPYELEYRSVEIFQQSQTLADIAGFYRAFGFESTGPLTEREDHAATEWEFLSILSFKESLVTNPDQFKCCVDAQHAFLTDHAGAWMPAFFERIRRMDADSFLAKVAVLADAVLRQWCGLLDVAVGPKWLELRTIDEEDSTISCGAPGAVEMGPTLAAAMDERR